MFAFSTPPKGLKVLGRDALINKTEMSHTYLVCILVLVYHYTFLEVPNLHKRGEMCG